MFKKKPNIKPLAPLRSSDRRKTADRIIADYGLEIPPPDDTEADNRVAATAGQTNLRNSVLPGDIQTARFSTTSGPDLKQVSGTIYVGSHTGDEQRILWVKIEDVMYPTVYTLWHNPGILPLLHTPSIVIGKLQGGADLMTPGLAGGPPFPRQAKQDSVVAVAALEHPTVPLVVGKCLIDVSALQQVQGAKGHAVETVHWSGDEVWAWSASGKAGIAPPQEVPGWAGRGSDEDKDLVERTEAVDLSDGEDGGGVSLHASNAGKEQSTEDNGNQTAEEDDLVESDTKDMTTHEIDMAFRKAFLYGIHHYKNTNKDLPNFGLNFPLPQSFVMSHLVQPFLPAFTPHQATQLQIKNSSYKNIKKFIKSFDKDQILKSKDRQGNEVIVQDIDFDDRTVLAFVPYTLPKKENVGGTSVGQGEKATSASGAGDDSIGQTLRTMQVYKPKDKLSPVFETAKADPKAYYTPSEIRTVVTNYIEAEHLVSQTNKRLVILNPILANNVFSTDKPIDREVLAKGSVPRDALIDRILSICAPYHSITRNGDESSSPKPKAGAPPKVQITLETRSGNKTVTRVSGVEAFFVGPQPLADELRKACASSTSVDQLVGSSPKNPVMEIMVQGPQKDAVIKALERRGVHSAWVEYTDKTKKKR